MSECLYVSGADKGVSHGAAAHAPGRMIPPEAKLLTPEVEILRMSYGK